MKEKARTIKTAADAAATVAKVSVLGGGEELKVKGREGRGERGWKEGWVKYRRRRGMIKRCRTPYEQETQGGALGGGQSVSL